MAVEDLEATLLGYVLAAAHLPEEEPIMRWWRWADSKPTTASKRLELACVRHVFAPVRSRAVRRC